MSKPGTIYRIINQCYDPSEDIQEYIDISDNDNLIDDSDDANIISLDGSGRPFELSVIDNDENPFTVIKAQQGLIQFNSTFNVGMHTFATGSDQRWGVHVYIGDTSKTVFKGFLSTDGMREEFLPFPNIVTLTAVDNLGILKEIPLTDFNGDNQEGNYKLSHLLAAALSKTGLSLELRVAFNIKEWENNSDISTPNTDDEHIFSTIYLNAKTFEDKDLLKDCYSVIETILGHEAYVFQYQGYWWIVRVDEIEDPTRGLYVTSFDEEGEFIGNLGEFDFLKMIDKENPISFLRGTEIVSERPKKSVRLNFNYNFPDEIPCNVDFSKGDYLADIDSDSKKYEIDCWISFLEDTAGDSAPTIIPYIQKNFTNGYETERFVVLPAVSSGASSNFILSKKIPVKQGDTIDVGLTRRLSSDISGSGNYQDNGLQVRLYADDGTYYMLKGETDVSPGLEWKVSDSDFFTNRSYFFFIGDVSRDMTESESLFGETTSPDIPKTGYIRLAIHQTHLYNTSKDTYIESLTFRVNARINGSIDKFDGQYHYTEQSGNYLSKIDEDVTMSDSPSLIVKGSMLNLSDWVEIWDDSVLFNSGTTFQVDGYHLDKFTPGDIIRITGTTSNNITTRIKGVSYSLVATDTIVEVEDTLTSETSSATIEVAVFDLASEFYNAAVFTSGPPDYTYVHRYGEIQLFDVWNQHKTEKRVIRGILQGMDLEEEFDGRVDMTHLINKWNPTDFSWHTINKYFMLLTFSQNHRNGEWTGTFREVVDLTRAKDYSNHEFKYF